MSNFVTVSTGNSKLGPAIPSINLPAGTTCNPNAPCFKGCYATRGRFLYPNAKNSQMGNLNAYLENPQQYFEDIAYRTRLSLFVRWHSSGDIIDERYLEGMCWVARQNPNTQYLAFTKQFEIVNNYKANKHRIPRNLHIVFSSWKDWVPENPYKFPTSWVYFPKDVDNTNQHIPANAVVCPNNCAKCQRCWSLGKGESVQFKKH